MTDPRSQALFERAARVIPGGVNSPVRAFRAVGGTPVFISRAEGAYLHSAGGARFIDYVGSWGPMVLGHAQPQVVEAIREAALRGTSYGAPTEGEVVFAEKIVALYPSIEMVRAVSSGTEATMSALRAARGFTGRDVVVKFEGCYHGHADFLLVKAGSGAATLGVPDSAGVPAATAANTATLPYNDVAALEAFFAPRAAENRGRHHRARRREHGGRSSGGRVSRGHRRGLCARHGAVSIFDEVMTGCRVARGGMQERAGVRPDMTCLGKIVGGGLPLAVYGGRRAIMEKVAPLGPVYQAGTLSGNPLAIAAGLATLARLDAALYERLEVLGARLERGLVEAAARASAKTCVQRVGSMLTPFFAEGPIRSWSDAKECDTKAFAAWHRRMLGQGIYWPPAQFEAAFVSAAHSERDIDETVLAAQKAF